MKSIQEHREILENYFEKIKDLPQAERVEKLVALYPESKPHFDLLKKSQVFCTSFNRP